jgi:shikimate dehydrogenase
VTQPGRLVLIGHPVAHSLSPAFQNAALRRAGIPLVYEALDVAPSDLRAALDTLMSERAAGNVTIPHKSAVFARCDVCTALAERVGAVNTFWSLGSELHGDNTDVGGFEAAVTAAIGGEPSGGLTLIGAGGSAAAVCAAAERWSNVEVRIVSRSQTRARELAARFAPVVTVASGIEAALEGCSLVVNATPLGMQDGDPLPVPIDQLPPDAAVVDLVYRSGGTAWVRAARTAGLSAVDGLPMLVEQGALAFERWFGVAPDRGAMWNAVS